MLGIAFSAYTWGAKEVLALYLHEPWQDDPYDAVVSFAMIMIPLLTALVALRTALGAAELPARRAIDLVRASRLIVGVVAVTELSDWVSLAFQAHQDAWNSTTAAMVAGLATFSLCTVAVVEKLRLSAAHRDSDVPDQPDWATDAVVLLERLTHHLGKWRPSASSAVRWVDNVVIARVRFHPVAAAAVFSILLGAAADAPQVVLEGYGLGLAALFITISACSTFAFVALAGRYLRLVSRRGAPLRPGVATSVAVAASVPLAATFRGGLWWVVGSSEANAGPQQLASLLAVFAVATAIVCGSAAWRGAGHTRAVLRSR